MKTFFIVSFCKVNPGGQGNILTLKDRALNRDVSAEKMIVASCTVGVSMENYFVVSNVLISGVHYHIRVF